MRRGPKPAKSKEAKSPVARKSLKDDDAKIRDLVKRLAESQAQQTTTSEILRVISSSPTDLQPVFEAILRSAQRLLGARTTSVFRRLGDAVHLAAFTSAGEAGDAAYKSLFPMSLDDYRERFPFAMRDWVTGTVTHIPDVERDARSPDIARPLAHARAFRSVLQVPMRRQGQVIGVLGITRTEPGAFADDEIALAQTFADQAVIAIENVRLFKELQTRNQDLTTALDRQTTTADVLRIIAQSPTELQPVLDAIATSAMRLCEASDGVIERLEGDRFYNAAHAGTQMKGLVGLPLPLTPRFPGGRAILDRRPIIIDDIQLVAASEYPDTLELLKLNTIHSVAEIPLLSEGKPLGSLAVLRVEMRPFTEAEVALLKTFADQAGIAIENVRLFTELQEKNQALTLAHAQVSEALDQQTATSEILRVISRSQTDVQPVFDTL